MWNSTGVANFEQFSEHRAC